MIWRLRCGRGGATLQCGPPAPWAFPPADSQWMRGVGRSGWSRLQRTHLSQASMPYLLSSLGARLASANAASAAACRPWGTERERETSQTTGSVSPPRRTALFKGDILYHQL